MKPSECKRLVVKVGSALLVDRETGDLKTEWLNALCDDLAQLQLQGTEVVVVSSGAIAFGRKALGWDKGTLELDQSQAAAATGQPKLMAAWDAALSKHSIVTAQILLTFSDTEELDRYLNARATVSRLLIHKVIPVFNENDTVATDEIKYGDNDRLAARIAGMIEADGLILLSDIRGMYTANPQIDSTAQFLDVIENITPEIEAMAGGAASEYSRGGMKTKVDAAKIAVKAGCTMFIANGKIMNPVKAMEQGGRYRYTVFKASQTPLQGRRQWIAGTLKPQGRVIVDSGAVAALFNGSSLLPAGVTAIEGQFKKGVVLSVVAPDGQEIARGLTAYNSLNAKKMIGKRSDEIKDILGHHSRSELIHRDNMVML